CSRCARRSPASFAGRSTATAAWASARPEPDPQRGHSPCLGRRTRRGAADSTVVRHGGAKRSFVLPRAKDKARRRRQYGGTARRRKPVIRPSSGEGQGAAPQTVRWYGKAPQRGHSPEDQALTRLRYSPLRVSISIRSPICTNAGTCTSKP